MTIQHSSNIILAILLLYLVNSELLAKGHSSSEQQEQLQNNWLPQPARQPRASRTREKDYAPRQTHQPTSVLLGLHESHSIECPVEARPEPDSVLWFKDGQELTDEAQLLAKSGKELTFLQIKESDEGDYHCLARNYLGQVATDRFRISVNSSVPDASIRVEPQQLEVAHGQSFALVCLLPHVAAGLFNRKSGSEDDSEAELGELVWRRNGKTLPVHWLDDVRKEDPDISRAKESLPAFIARQVGPTEFVLNVTMAQTSADHNSTYTCMYRWPESRLKEELPRESALPARIYVRALQPMPDSGLAPPIEDLMGTNNQPSTPSDRQRQLNQLLRWTQLTRLSLIVGLSVLILLLIGLVLVQQRRRASRHQNRYMKHLSASNSSGESSSGSGVSTGDPMLSSLMARTLSAPLSGAGTFTGAGKKFRSYRDHMRKVGAVHHDNPAANNCDLVHSYLACQQQQQQHLMNQHLPALPNLYNQSLAAREQARALLLPAQTANEHMRSLHNLDRQHKPAFNQNQNHASHLNLAMNFPSNTTSAPQNLLERLLGPSSSTTERHLPFDHARPPHQPQPHAHSQEHYQLLSCSTSSPPSSTSSTAGYSTHTGPQPQLNHYSTIENQLTDRQLKEDCYEEVEHGYPSSAAMQHRVSLFQHNHQQQHQPSAFLTPDAAFDTRPLHRQSSSFTRNRLRSTATTKHSDTNQLAAGDTSTAATHATNQDQLSPYAVSAISGVSVSRPPPPPPVTSEAMRALNEQFDISQLMLLDEASKDRSTVSFDAPPPPPPSN